MYNAVWRNNKLYAAFNEGFDWGEGGGTVSAIRYLKINTSTNSTELDVRYGMDGFDYFLPTITTDSSENIVIVFARSSPSEFAGIHYTGRRASDNVTQSSAVLKAGVQCITGFRWGDYFGAAIDPADGTRVWIYGEWAKDVVGISPVWDWGTWIGAVTIGLPIVDNTDTTGTNFFSAVGSWTSSTYTPGFFGTDYQYAAAGNGSKTATWTFEINQAGQYEVAANWTASSNRAPDAPYTILNNGNVLGVVSVDQRVNGGQFNSLGTFALDAGTLEVVLTDAASNFVIADAVRVSSLQ